MADGKDRGKSDEGMSKVEAALAELAELERESEQRSREFHEAFSALMRKQKERLSAPVDQQTLDSLPNKQECAEAGARLQRVLKAVEEFLQVHPEGFVAYLEILSGRP